MRVARARPVFRALRRTESVQATLGGDVRGRRRWANLGFATVAASSIERAHVPSARLRKRLPEYPLPVLRLARLGVDARAQGVGVGKCLLLHVLKVALAQRDRLGCVGVVTDAKPDAVSFYERLGFIPLEGVREGLLHGEPQPMFLAIGTVSAARDG